MLIINLKTYKNGTGEQAVKIAEKCADISEQTGRDIVVAPQHTDLREISDTVKSFSQHVDPVKPGSHTGAVVPELLKKAGAGGSLLNHSERRIPEEKIKESVKLLRELNMTSVVSAKTPEECKNLSSYSPDYIAFEPPELIGGSRSVSEAKPEMIRKAVKNSKVPVLTGAGIKSEKDVEKAMELGCEGVLVASSVVDAEDSEEKIRELARGL